MKNIPLRILSVLFALLLFGYSEAGEPVMLKTGTGTICGTLEIPRSTHPVPVALISPDKDVNFRYTTAAFTLSPEPGASLCRANLPGDWALYAISVRRLIALHSGFLQTVPRGSALAFA